MAMAMANRRSRTAWPATVPPTVLAAVVAAVVTAAALAGCSSPDDEASPSTVDAESADPTVETVETSDATQTLPTLPVTTAPTSTASTGPPSPARMLGEQRRQWNVVRPDRYTFTYQAVCQCGPEVAGPFTATVDGDSVIESTIPPEADLGEFPPTVLTIDGIFDLAQESFRNGAVTIEYDPTFGFPSSITVDPSPRVADDETTYQVTAFAPA
jgi:hypothetical protein